MSRIAKNRVWVSLGLLGVVLAGMTALAGPINPPVGPVGSTGRTLDEIYNRIPAVGAADGRVPIAAASFTVTISQPGSYVLTGNIAVTTGNGINISGNNITLDLNGFTVSSTVNAGTGIGLVGTASGCVVRNGLVVGFGTGVLGSSSASRVLVEDMVVRGTKSIGIGVTGNSNHQWRVRRCSVFDAGDGTTSADGNIVIIGINFSGGTQHVAEDCLVAGMVYNGIGTPTFKGIATAVTGANMVIRCTVTNSVAITGTGITAGTGCLYRDNSVAQFSTHYTAGTAVDAGGNF